MAFGSKGKRRNDEYDDTNRGALFENDRKQTEKHPDFKGSINVDGRDYWLSGWEKTSKKGQDFLSLSVQRKDEERRKESRRDDYERDDPMNFDDYDR